MKIQDKILMEAISDEEKYDRSIKALFLSPRIIAPIIKMTIREYADVPVEDIWKSS